MKQLGIAGNELLLFAMIYGFTQDDIEGKRQGCFYGSLTNISDRIGVSRPTAISLLKRLCSKGLIEKNTDTGMPTYKVSKETLLWLRNFTDGKETLLVKKLNSGSKETLPKVVKKLNSGSKETLPNNKRYNKSYIKSYNKERRSKFSKPSISDIEKYCSERNNGVDAQTFCDFYESKGWKVGSNPMVDWKACVRTWEKRSSLRAEGKKERFTPERKKSGIDATLEQLQRMGIKDIE